jgi:hypothetical protein
MKEWLAFPNLGLFIVPAIQQLGSRRGMLFNNGHAGAETGLRGPDHGDSGMAVDIFEPPRQT